MSLTQNCETQSEEKTELIIQKKLNLLHQVAE